MPRTIKIYAMQMRLELALQYAKKHFGKNITKKELAKAMWPESDNPYMNLYNLQVGSTKNITVSQIETVCRLTGIPVNMLLQ